jgi:phosphatidylserine decarboxylase
MVCIFCGICCIFNFIMKIAKDSVSFLIVLAILALGAYIFNFLVATCVFSVLFLFVCFFFRDPKRRTPKDDNLVFSPADGTISEINEVVFDDKPYYQIVIFLSVFNVHINRIPYKGTIISAKHFPGKFYAAFRKNIEEKNERMEVVMQTDKGKMKFVQITGAIARRIVCNLTPGQKVGAGEKFGLIKFGSRTDLYVPKETAVTVSLGQKVCGGVTVMGRFS